MTTVDGRRRGLFFILIATAVAGVSGYAIQLLAPALLHDAEAYVAFSVFWSLLYLFVGAIGGVQQEITRAVHPAENAERVSSLRIFTVVAAGVLVLVALVVGVILAPTTLAVDPVGLTAWFAIGLVGYLGVATLSGVLYGLSFWSMIATLTIVDAVVRGLLVTVGLLLGGATSLLAAAIAMPFTAALVVVWGVARKRVVGRFRLDVDVRRLALNVMGTVVAAAATGVLVTGLPFLLRLSLPDAPIATLASLIAVITITRAPLIVPLMALQSYLIVDFRSAGAAVWPRLARYVALMAVTAAAACVLAWFFGSWAISAVSSGRYVVSDVTIVCIVASAGLVGLLCITGSALLSEGRHGFFVGGWVAAAMFTVLALQIPLDTIPRTLTALLAGPVVGLMVHVLGVRPRTPQL
ncbi:hypothetical protein [Microbacterium aurum]